MQLAGELTKVNLPSLISLLRNGELTGKVCLTHGAQTAFMYADAGRIVHVESDTLEGSAALLELFLWSAGTFSFIEGLSDDVPRTIPADEPIEKIIREGLNYLDEKRYLDHLRITTRTILARTNQQPTANPIVIRLDGRKTLGEISSELNLTKREYVMFACEAIEQGLAVVAQPVEKADQVKLPPWVVSRLKQDNPDISQAIVEMVIWVDRVKCWMYQADADLERIIANISQPANNASSGPPSANEELPLASSIDETAGVKPARGIDY